MRRKTPATVPFSRFQACIHELKIVFRSFFRNQSIWWCSVRSYLKWDTSIRSRRIKSGRGFWGIYALRSLLFESVSWGPHKATSNGKAWRHDLHRNKCHMSIGPFICRHEGCDCWRLSEWQSTLSTLNMCFVVCFVVCFLLGSIQEIRDMHHVGMILPLNTQPVAIPVAQSIRSVCHADTRWPTTLSTLTWGLPQRLLKSTINCSTLQERKKSDGNTDDRDFGTPMVVSRCSRAQNTECRAWIQYRSGLLQCSQGNTTRPKIRKYLVSSMLSRDANVSPHQSTSRELCFGCVGFNPQVEVSAMEMKRHLPDVRWVCYTARKHTTNWSFPSIMKGTSQIPFYACLVVPMQSFQFRSTLIFPPS